MTVTLEAADDTPPATTCADVIRRAARRLGIVTGTGTPTGGDSLTLMEYLQDIINGLPLLSVGDWTDVILDSTAAYEANDGDRIILDGVDPAITLPATYQDDNGDDVMQRDLSRVQVVGTGTYVWASSRGAWAKVTDLEASDAFPFGPDDVAGVASMIAVAAAPEYGAELSPITLQSATTQRNAFRGRFYRVTARRAEGVFY